MGDEREYARLAERFRPVFARIADGDAERERGGRAPHEQLGWLVDAGFARLRVPAAHGGDEVPLSFLLRLVAELAAADAQVAHVWRNHVSFLEDRRHARDDPRSAEWLERLGRGEIVGGGWSEPGTAFGAGLGDPQTRLRKSAAGDAFRLDGVKLYSTGSVFARWATVLATGDDGERLVALVDTGTPGVTIGDDWDGFGQRLTGSGSVRYEDVAVPADRVFLASERYGYQSQYYQSMLNALLVGIANALVRETAAALAARTRGHANNATSDVRTDPELLGVIGGLATAAYAAESAFLRSVALLDAVADVDVPDPDDLRATWLAVAQTQVLLSNTLLDAASHAFDALGASGVSRSLGLDRHWRNARTIISHNPWLAKRRIVGDHRVNGSDPLAY